jgi:cytochrome c peroxidase
MTREIPTIRNVLVASSFALIMSAALGTWVVAPPAEADEGEIIPGTQIIDNSGMIPFDQAFFAFEVESPLGSLKEVPIWHEIERMLDNPYQYAQDPSVRGNDQGWPSYRLTQPRRQSFIFRNAAGNPCAPGSAGCTQVPLPRHVIHPLNYNHSTGEELRLVNIDFEGLLCSLADESDCWLVPDQLIPTDTGYEFTYRPTAVSAGELRVEDDEAAADFNSPMAEDTPFEITSVDQFYSPDLYFFEPGSYATALVVPEGSLITGGDHGEPGYEGFGVLETPSDEQYSVPAVPGPTGPGDVLVAAVERLFDPARGTIQPRSGATGGLRKPSLRITDADLGVNGTPGNPDYLVNSMANLSADPTALLPSNENDYYRGATLDAKNTARSEAAALGKALFWDMQVGSDAVQACASCHFHAGADNRTKNQTNPGVNGNDLTLQLHGGLIGQNTNFVATDFPLHRGAQDSSSDPNPASPNTRNQFDNVNDVASSMGVRFRRFDDIRTPGLTAFSTCPTPAGTCVRTLLPDIGDDPPSGQSADPIPLFQGLRRVEPRNTPTFFASAMNFDNFWDGRARHDFNGGSVFGPSDPQAHVFATSGGPLSALIGTRQIIRFSSLASLATGPALSEFEMSFRGRNWAKIGKKLLQGVGIGPLLTGRVTPLANQLVAPSDSVIGRYSNQGGSACATLPPVDRVVGGGGTAAGKPGLCISYPGLIRRAFYPRLWQSMINHLNGCYTDTDADPALKALHENQCSSTSINIPVFNFARRGNQRVVFNTSATGLAAIPILGPTNTVVATNDVDPFDNYVLTPAGFPPVPTNTNQFSQMEANMPLFFGLSVQAWSQMLIPDDSPFDRFMDDNPDSFATFGESGEPGIALDLRNCTGPNGTGGVQPCFTPVGNFTRDPGVVARINCPVENQAGCTVVPAGGNRTAGSVDPLMGMDFFLGSNMSLKNPNFRSLRCGECHAGGTLTDHTFEISHQVSFGDRIQEFVTGQPGVEIFPEALGRGRVISGFLLEGELQENAQDGIERNVADFCTAGECEDANGNPVPGTPANGFPQGQALFDNGMYNIGVTPIKADVMRGGKDPFGWPLSLSYLALKNLCGVAYTPGGDDPLNAFRQPTFPGLQCDRFQPDPDTLNSFTGEEGDPTGGGLFEETAQDQEINPGFAEEPADPQLPEYLAPWASNIPVGDESNVDEVFVGINTVMREPMLEGFVDSWGPFNPAAIIGESFNSARQPEMAMWPNVNRVNVQGGVKAPPLRHVEMTGPFFHNGDRLTLAQQLDFYVNGGNFPKTNAQHRDFLIANLRAEDEALGGCLDPTTDAPVDCSDAGAVPEFDEGEKDEIIRSVVDYLLELTDERVKLQRAPFDQPEIFVPLDGKAPDNGALAGAVIAGRQGFVNNTSGECEATDASPGACFQRVLQTGRAGTATPLPNFLGVVKGDRNNPNCNSATGPISHYCIDVQ